jgi:hypothetical protein
MRNKILNNIKTGLEATLGKDSTVYDDVLIEDVQNRLPDSVTVNYFLGVNIDRGRNLSKEIGKIFPVINNYNCNIVIMVKNADYDTGQTELDTIFKRILKYFIDDSGSLAGLSDTTAGITENVISYSLDDFDYIEGKMKTGGLGHVCTLALSIKTHLNS